jgi:hypothetical protein
VNGKAVTRTDVSEVIPGDCVLTTPNGMVPVKQGDVVGLQFLPKDPSKLPAKLAVGFVVFLGEQGDRVVPAPTAPLEHAEAGSPDEAYPQVLEETEGPAAGPAPGDDDYDDEG